MANGVLKPRVPPVRTIMSPEVTTVTPQTPVVDIAALMAEKHISCVVVGDRIPLGMVSERDLVKAFARRAGELRRLKAVDVMSTPVETLRDETSVVEAVNLMGAKGFRRFPIVDKEGRLVGIVTQTDALKAINSELEITHDILKDLALKDSLTGLFNRRSFLDHLQNEFYRTKRYNAPLSVILLDLDDFKKVNDLNGHQVGDQVLAQVAQTLKNMVRTSDYLCRFGGEEFVLVCPYLDREHALALGERLRAALEKTHHTASFGVACFPDPDVKFPEDLIRLADLAMYKAKALGKNRVVAWERSMEDDLGRK